MTLLTRRILYVIFIIAFLVITPLVIAYAAGYKIKIGKGLKLNFSFQKTGMLVLDSQPRGARIYLNGEAQQLPFKKYFLSEESYIATPTKIKNLLPEEYEVKLELNGYWDWQKKLTVSAGASTYAEDVYLFKNNLPVSLASGRVSQSSLAPDKKYLLIAGDDEVSVFDLTTEEKIRLSGLSAWGSEKKPLEISWSRDSNKLLINATIFSLASPDAPVRPDPKSENIKWSGNMIYYLSRPAGKDTGLISSFDPDTKENKVVFASDPALIGQNEKITDFLIKNKNVFFIVQSGEKIKLNISEIDSQKIIRTIDLPPFSQYSFINPEHKFINLYDQERQTLYLIDPFSYFPLAETINNIKYNSWINEDKLLYANDFEIWLYGIKNRNKTLLTRISSPIEKALWHPSNNYIVYATENSVNTIELDDREKRNTTELIKLDKIFSPYLNARGDILYFSAKIGNQEGLYKLALQ
ncbi:hypothetical protein HY798_01020 [Candidatus Falkowbacteria bacterium]|nr:hypothetical protein [Candidatus Falkowbacteria bacterium]